MTRFAPAIVVALTALSKPPVAAQTYNPATEFSTTTNPNGVWRYGQSTSLGGALSLYPNLVDIQGLQFWQVSPSGDNPPYVSHNGTTSTINYQGMIPYVPGQLGLHPGPSGEYSVIRWTAPADLEVLVSGSFYRLDEFATTDVHIMKNGVSVFDGTINSSTPASFSTSQFALTGDTIDFVVGTGGNGYGFDSTGLSATIQVQPVPEPTGLVALTGGALTAAAAFRRWRLSK